MSTEISTDLIRWTFSTKPEARAEIETYLNDQGLDVVVHGEAAFSVSWEEPDVETDAVVEAMWEMNGEPFHVTQETFHRLTHVLIHAEGEEFDEEESEEEETSGEVV